MSGRKGERLSLCGSLLNVAHHGYGPPLQGMAVDGAEGRNKSGCDASEDTMPE